jgi:hypothetical protein
MKRTKPTLTFRERDAIALATRNRIVASMTEPAFICWKCGDCPTHIEDRACGFCKGVMRPAS